MGIERKYDKSYLEEHNAEKAEMEIIKGYRMGQFFCDLVFDAEQRAEYAGIIEEANHLYYALAKQTWQTTRWRGIHICKVVSDSWIYQELITVLRPKVIIETGVFEGGSAVFYSDIMKLEGIDGLVIGVDHDLTNLNPLVLKEIENGSNICLIDGDSTSEKVFDQVWDKVSKFAKQGDNIMVSLDSEHSYEQVTKELDLYSRLVNKGSILIVEDTTYVPGVKNALADWLKNHPEFQSDYTCERYLLTGNREGWLERVS